LISKPAVIRQHQKTSRQASFAASPVDPKK